MSSSKKSPSVAIAGATGVLGSYVAKAFLDPRYRAQFDKIILLMRKPVDDLSKLLGVPDASGATVRTYNEDNIESSLQDVDIVISTIGSKGDAFRNKLVQAIAKTGVQLYFPSEFGIDHTTTDFAHGSPDTPITLTSMGDVGRAVVQLALMPPDQVPAVVRLAGDTKSTAEIAALMEAAGSPPIRVTSRDLAQFKQETIDGKTTDPSLYLRFLMGEGKLDHRQVNSNELVNPRQANWKWKTLDDLARETKGRPWAELPWPPS